MQDCSTGVDLDADRQAGNAPWTIFAYPASLANAEGLPADEDARRYLQELKSRGLRVGVWRHSEIEDTIYFACPVEDRVVVQTAIEDLEREGIFPKDFASTRCEELFALVYGDQ